MSRSHTDLAGEAEVVGGAVELAKDLSLGRRVPHSALTVSVQYLSGGETEEGTEGGECV